MTKTSPRTHLTAEPLGQPLFTPRFVISVVLMVVGIAWIIVFYTVLRGDPTLIPPAKGSGPSFLVDLHRWNYVIGFGLFFLGLALAAHPSTPLGRGRGVVVGMLACFLLGLLWICTFYVFSNKLDSVPVFNDLGQYNLVIGIVLMAIGFTYATRWE